MLFDVDASVTSFKDVTISTRSDVLES